MILGKMINDAGVFYTIELDGTPNIISSKLSESLS